MKPGAGGEPTGDLAGAINDAFASFSDFKEKLSNAAATQFGSGRGWLVVDESGKLQVYGTPNNDSPYMQGHTPILGVDVWKHSYYTKCQSVRNASLNHTW